MTWCGTHSASCNASTPPDTVQTPPGWPQGLPPPEVEGWEAEAAVWLLDVGPSHFRLDPFLPSQPVVLARRVVEHLQAEVDTSRKEWVPLPSWEHAGLPADAHQPVLMMLRRVGPVLVARLHSAEQVRDALTGRRWVPRL
jgi:hypothetical protein